MYRQDVEDLISLYGLDQIFQDWQRGIIDASHTRLSSDSRCPVSKQPLRRHTQICIAYCMHIFTHGQVLVVLPDICTSSYSGSSDRHPTPYAELLLESMLASLGTSVTAFLWPGQVTPRGQKWAKDGNLIPSWKSSRPASAANVIHSSCDTAAMCWGLFLRNGRVELESCWILLASVRDDKLDRAEDLLRKCRVFVRAQITIQVNWETFGRWTLLLRNKRFAHMAKSIPSK